MTVKNIGSNMTQIEKADGTIVLVSYSTPVAACLGDGSGFVRTSERFSVTTSKHINKWLEGRQAQERPQAFFDAIL